MSQDSHEHTDRADTGLLKLEKDARPHAGTPQYPGGQLAMMRGAMTHKFFTLACGRRTGKTSSNLFLGIEEQGQHEGFYYLGHVSTDHAKAKEVFEAALKVLGGDPRINPNSLVKSFRRDNGQDRWIETHSMGPLNTGGKWYFWSGQYPNYDAIQGYMFPFHRLIVDEMQLQYPQLVEEILIPMSMDQAGKILLEGHPKRGKIGNHYYKIMFTRGKNPDPEWRDYGSFNIPFEGSPYNDVEEGRLARQSCVDKQTEIEEYDGLFGNEEGSIFKNVEEVCCLPVREPPAWFLELAHRLPMRQVKYWFGTHPHPRRKYVLSVDWAKERDYTVIMVFDRTRNEQVCVIRIRGEEYDLMFEWLKEIAWQYRAVIHGDGNGVGAAMGSMLRTRFKTGYREHKFHPANKEDYVRRGQWHFNANLVQLLDIEEQKHEFHLFQLVPVKHDDGMGGKHQPARYGHPPGEHDDFVDSYLMLAEALSAAPLRERPGPKQREDAPPEAYDMAWFFEQANARTAGVGKIRPGSLTRYG